MLGVANKPGGYGHDEERQVDGERARRVQPDPSSANGPALTDGQREIVRLIAEGSSNRETAAQVHLSENTVKTHIQETFRKFGAHNRVDAAIKAAKHGLI